MAIQIGTDEAGYGPKLGPLVIAGTEWDVPSTNSSLYELLYPAVSNSPASQAIPFCDSKAIFKPQQSDAVKRLELSVLAALYSYSGSIPRTVAELAEQSGFSGDLPSGSDCFDCRAIRLPIAADVDEVVARGTDLASCCRENRVQLRRAICRVIFPAEFNHQVEKLGNKAELLSSTTLALVRSLAMPFAKPTRIECDKHGGRSRYAGLIAAILTDGLVHVECESRPVSSYSFSNGNCSCNISFRAGGESFLPTALASMLAKYVRELYMIGWNRFWVGKLPGLKPTQGYPLDAARFHREIAGSQKKLKISDRSIWRSR